jgi:Mn2+/Fe2+ NRAMP family transporter
MQVTGIVKPTLVGARIVVLLRKLFGKIPLALGVVILVVLVRLVLVRKDNFWSAFIVQKEM